jgi:hypothetical protein
MRKKPWFTNTPFGPMGKMHKHTKTGYITECHDAVAIGYYYAYDLDRYVNFKCPVCGQFCKVTFNNLRNET